MLGGARLRVGTLLGLGTSVVTFGLFFADAGTPIAYGAHLMGAGLILSLVGWLACAAGGVIALRAAACGAPGRPQRHAMGLFLALTLAALGAAASFAPSWDSFTLRTSAGVTHTLTAGNAFSSPGAVIAGDLAVMIALVAVVAVAALWRPTLMGAALLAGAIIPMAAQAISALVQLGQHVDPSQFGISAAEASPGRAHDQLRRDPGLLDLLCLRPRLDRHVRQDADPDASRLWSASRSPTTTFS